MRQRLLAQLQGDQLDIFRLQNQVSTGRRITLPSEDAPAAQRAITLQRLIERKTQLRVERRHRAVVPRRHRRGPDRRRHAAGRHPRRRPRRRRHDDHRRRTRRGDRRGRPAPSTQLLSRRPTRSFAAAICSPARRPTSSPTRTSATTIKYSRQRKVDRAISPTSACCSPPTPPGANVFGGISDEVLGGDRPQSAAQRRHAAQQPPRRPRHQPNGALQISDGTNSVVVDISRAVTVGDVVRLIEENPPAGRPVTASITGTGPDAAARLRRRRQPHGHGSRQRQGGQRAGHPRRQPACSPTRWSASDLDPAILKTTRLDDLLGVQGPRTTRLARRQQRPADRGRRQRRRVQRRDDPVCRRRRRRRGSTPAYAAGTLDDSHPGRRVDGQRRRDGHQRRRHVHRALDPTDTANPGASRHGHAVDASRRRPSPPAAAATTLDLASGLRVVNGGQTHTIDFGDAETVEDLLNSSTAPTPGCTPTINADRHGHRRPLAAQRRRLSDWRERRTDGHAARHSHVHAATSA